MRGHLHKATVSGTPSRALILLAALFSLTAQGSLAAQDTSADRRPFHLKAIMEDMPQLSRDELGLPQTSKPAHSSQPIDVSTLPLSGQVEDLANLTGMLPPPISRAASPFPEDGSGSQPDRLPQSAQTPDDSEMSVEEYGVDWRPWVSKLADKWFFVLKRMEERSGYNFHTARPALIHFTCYNNGQIGNVYLKQSSGVPVYDQMQIHALLQCMPLHAFPKGTKRTTFTLVQGWESHPRRPGEEDYRPGSFNGNTPMEIVRQWMKIR